MQEKDNESDGRTMGVVKKAAIIGAALGVGIVIAGKVVEYRYVREADVREALGFFEGYEAGVTDRPATVEVMRPIHVNEFRRTSKLGNPHTVSAHARRRQVHQPLRGDL